MEKGRPGGVKNTTPPLHTTHSLTISMYARGPKNSLEALREGVVEPKEAQVGPEEVEQGVGRGSGQQQSPSGAPHFRGELRLRLAQGQKAGGSRSNQGP